MIDKGIRADSDHLSEFIFAVGLDVLEGALSPHMANSFYSGTGKMLKVKDMEFRYGGPGKNGQRVFSLFSGRGPAPARRRQLPAGLQLKAKENAA